MSSWQKVFSDNYEYRVSIVKSVLADMGINSVIVNKKNSAFNNFGHFELHVEPENVIRSIKIIKDDINFEEL